MYNAKPIEILLVEDNPSDTRLIKECFKNGSMPNHVTVVDDGETALAFLRREVGFTDAPRPDLVLLDLELPKLHGLEVLRTVKSDAALLSIPIVVLTASAITENVVRAYQLHASCFLSKPNDWDGFVELVRSIEQFWLRRVTLPSWATDSS